MLVGIYDREQLLFGLCPIKCPVRVAWQHDGGIPTIINFQTILLVEASFKKTLIDANSTTVHCCVLASASLPLSVPADKYSSNNNSRRQEAKPLSNTNTNTNTKLLNQHIKPENPFIDLQIQEAI